MNLRKFLATAVLLFSVANANSLTLDAALSRTLEKNPEIAQARIALEHAAGRRLIFRSTFSRSRYSTPPFQRPCAVATSKC
jgi:hypothetical protein